MRGDILINSPLKRGESLGSGGGTKCYEDARFYAANMGYEIVRRGQRDFNRVLCFSLSMRHPYNLNILAFGPIAEKALALRKRQDAFHEACNQMRPSPEFEARTKMPEYIAIQKSFLKLCDETLFLACKKENVFQNLLKQTEEIGYRRGIEDNQAQLRKALGINEVF